MSALSSATRIRRPSRAPGSGGAMSVTPIGGGSLSGDRSHWPASSTAGCLLGVPSSAFFGSPELLLRQMIRAERNRHDERASTSNDALDAHGPAVCFDQLADAREADAGALKAPTARALDAVKAVADLGELARRDFLATLA